MFVNPNVDVTLDVDLNVGSLDVLDDVVNVEVVPRVMFVVNEVCAVDILLADLVHVEVVVNVFGDDDDEVLLNEVCSSKVMISPLVDVVVADDVIDAGASELDVEVLLDVFDEDVDVGVKVSEGECERCGDLSALFSLLLLVILLVLLK